MKAADFALAVAFLAACSGAETAEQDNPLRHSLEQSVTALDPLQPLTMRYNPTTCACPPLELRVASTWLRAELTGNPQILQPWLTMLEKTLPENLPAPVQIQGKVERDLLRTETGSYGVRVELTRILLPLPQKN